MRKTLNINLGGIAFIIDENAFEFLHNYLEALKRKFNNEAERTEIINDIESRIAEMLNERLQSRKEVIAIEDVQFVTDAMGRPEDIAGEEPAETGNGASQNSASATTTSSAASAPVKKRLFRDPDDAKIGGVISGLCHYFGIADPTWMRIAALVFIYFTAGTIILIYFLLLIIVPKAQTAAEKLQMKGEPININTIEKEIKEAASKAGESVNEFMHDQNIFERLWDATLSVLRVFLKIFAVFDIFLAMILLIAVSACFFAFYVLGSTPFNEASRMIVDSGSVIRFFSIGFLLFLTAPLIALIYLGLKILLGQRSRMRWLKSVLFIAWLIGLAFLLGSGYKALTNFRTTGTKNEDLVLMQPTRETLYVQLTDTAGKKLSKDWEDDIDYRFNINEQGQLIVDGNDFSEISRIGLGKPSLQLMPSENDSFYIQEVITAHGKDKNDAVKNAGMVVYSFAQSDSVLNLASEYYINKSDKYRAQQMRVRIAIPQGKKIRFADNIDIWRASVKGDGNYDDTYFANTTWTVEDGKVKCIEGENHINASDDSKDDDNEKVKAPAPLAAPGAPTMHKMEHEKSNDKHEKDDDDDKDF